MDNCMIVFLCTGVVGLKKKSLLCRHLHYSFKREIGSNL